MKGSGRVSSTSTLRLLLPNVGERPSLVDPVVVLEVGRWVPADRGLAGARTDNPVGWLGARHAHNAARLLVAHLGKELLDRDKLVAGLGNDHGLDGIALVRSAARVVDLLDTPVAAAPIVARHLHLLLNSLAAVKRDLFGRCLDDDATEVGGVAALLGRRHAHLADIAGLCGGGRSDERRNGDGQGDDNGAGGHHVGVLEGGRADQRGVKGKRERCGGV